MKNTELNLSVGSTMHVDLETDGNHESYPVTLIGYLDGKSLLVTMPQREGVPLHLDDGSDFIVRYTSGDSNYAFESAVIGTSLKPYPHLHLKYPEGVQGVMLRRGIRVPLENLAIMLMMTDGEKKISVAMTDISLSGARLVAPSHIGSVGDEFAIEMPTSPEVCAQGVVLPCVIRYIREEKSATSRAKRIVHHGVEFRELEKQAHRFVERFIKDQVSQQRGSE